MYLEYFSLERHPFRITPDPSLFFPGGAQGRGVVLDALVYGITSGEGILKVVGEVGSGKTMLCRMLEEKLPDSVQIVYLANPSLSARDIVYAIAIELGMKVDAATDRLLVMHDLQEYLLKKHIEGGSVVVFIEEAQSMPLETLEEVRLLSNLETHRHKLMQIVLFGQPELDKKLADKSIRQLKERITHSFYLSPLKQEEISSYLHFRLQAAGCPWPQLFSPKAEQMLAKASEGLTRRINILADKALLASYADPEARPQPRNTAGEIQPMVLPRHVKIAITDSNYRQIEGSSTRRWLGYGVAAVSGAAIVALLGWLGGWYMSNPGTTGALEVQGRQQVQATGVAGRNAVVQESDSSVPTESGTGLAETAAEVSAELAVVTEPEAEAEQATHQAPPQQMSVARTMPAAAAADVSMPASEEDSDPQAGPAAVTSNEEPDVQVRQLEAGAPAADLLSEQQLAGVSQVMASRLAASNAWLATLEENSTGYSVQMSAFPSAQTGALESFLETLKENQLLSETFLCLISATDSRPEQWLVLHGQFTGVSAARAFIDQLPETISQFGPYVRNTSGIACSNNQK